VHRAQPIEARSEVPDVPHAIEFDGARDPRPRRSSRTPAPLLAVAIAIALVLALGSAREAASEDAPRASEAAASWYAQEVARGERSFLVTHYWSKGDKLRAETVLAGRRIITIVNGPTYYTIDPTRSQGIAIARSSLAIADDAKRDRPFGDDLEALLRSGGEHVGSDELGGQPVERFRLTNEAGRVEVWVTADRKLPVRVTRFRRSSGTTDQKDYVNWLRDIPLDDAFFEPPSGLAIDRIGYEDYVRQSATKLLGPAPAFYGYLLHGEPEGARPGAN